MFTATNFPFSALSIQLLSSNVIHGEGNLLAHLVIIGYKIPYQQSPADGVRLCRAIQLLLHDPSILTKMVVPSHNRKKNLANCRRISLQYLKDAGVSLKDDKGMMIIGEDVSDGDRELTISLLWNIFVHLQLPLLINGRLLTEEIYKVQGLEQDPGGQQGPQSVMSSTEYHGAVQHFILSQKLTALLGSFPEVLQIGDLLEHNVIILLAFQSSNLIVKENLVGYLTNAVFSPEQLNFHKLLCSSCQAQEKRYSRISCSSSEAVTNEEPDRENGEDTTKSFQAIKAWWQDMANQNQNSVGEASSHTLQSSLSSKCITDSQREIAAVVIQSNIKGLHARRKFRKKMRAICFLQAAVRTWLSVKNIQVLEKLNVEEVTLPLSERSANLKPVARYVKFIVERGRFIKLRKSVSVIQKAVRRHQSNLHHELKAALKIQLAWRSYKEKVISFITIQSYVRGWITRRMNWTYKFSSILIQRYCRGWLARRKFYLQREATICIQSAIREFNCMMSFQRCKHAATDVQRLVMGQIVRSRLQGASTLYSKLDEGVSRLPQHSFGMTKMLHSVIKVQRWWREFLHSQNMRRKSAVLIQSHIRGLFARRRTLWKDITLS